MTDDRQQRLDAGFVLGQALGHHEAREALKRLGYQDGATLVPLNLGGLERHLPPEAIAEAAFELASAAPEQRDTITAAWRSTAEVYADPELLAALTRDSHEDGGRVTLPKPSGRTIAVYIPPEVPDEIADWLETAIADTVHDLDDGKPWDLHVAGQAGDPLNVWTDPSE